MSHLMICSQILSFNCVLYGTTNIIMHFCIRELFSNDIVAKMVFDELLMELAFLHNISLPIVMYLLLFDQNH